MSATQSTRRALTYSLTTAEHPRPPPARPASSGTSLEGDAVVTRVDPVGPYVVLADQALQHRVGLSQFGPGRRRASGQVGGKSTVGVPPGHIQERPEQPLLLPVFLSGLPVAPHPRPKRLQEQ